MRGQTRLGFAVLLSACAAIPATNTSAIEGQWSGTLEGLPAVRLTFEENDGQLRGAAMFFFIEKNPGKPVTATATFPEPMINPAFDGKAVPFGINHRYAHPPGSLNDAPVYFRFEVTGAGAGRLISPEAPPLEMVRSRYEQADRD